MRRDEKDRRVELFLRSNLLANLVLPVRTPVEHRRLPSGCEVGCDSSPRDHLLVPRREEREGLERRGRKDEETGDDVEEGELGERGLKAR